MQILILGREKLLCRAEAIAVFGSAKLLNDDVVKLPDDAKVDINMLGGAIKSGRVIKQNINKNPISLQTEISNFILSQNPEGKFSFGISYYGKYKMAMAPIGIKLKRSLQQAGLKPRYVQAKADSPLNAASVKYNKLIDKGFEIIVIDSGPSLAIAITTGVQDIDSYSKRDYDKPCRDRKVGMLPPKLSQIMINLSQPKPEDIIVDPFCGSGGLLIEAALMGFKSQGSDLAEEMVDCSKANINWLSEHYDVLFAPDILAPSDATKRTYPIKGYNIVSEGYLGRNFLSKPTKQLVDEQIGELRKLYLNFFSNLKNQALRPTKVVVTMPFWVFDDQLVELNIIDEIIKLGYTKSEFESVRHNNLLYHREGQYTGRQILVFTK